MFSRRAVLGRISAFLLGCGAIETVAGRETASNDSLSGDSEVSVTLNSSALERTTIPPSLEYKLEDVEQSTGIARTDVDRISVTATTLEGAVTSGRANITGQFDVERVAERLQSRRPAFEREPVRRGAEGRYKADNDVVERQPVVLVDRQESITVNLDQSHLLVATGSESEGALTHFSAEHKTGSTGWRAFDSPGELLAGDAVARVTLGEDARSHITAHSGTLLAPVVKLLQAMSTGGVAVDLGSETSNVRYALEFQSDAEISPEVSKLIKKVTAHQGVERIHSATGGSHLIVDLTVDTDSLWETHGEVLTTGSGTRF